VKQRREAQKKEAVVKINGLFCKVVSQDEYVVEGQQIMTASEAGRTSDTVDPTKKENKTVKKNKQKKERAEYTPQYDFTDE